MAYWLGFLIVAAVCGVLYGVCSDFDMETTAAAFGVLAFVFGFCFFIAFLVQVAR